MDSDDAHFLPLGERAQVIFALSYNALIVVIIVFVLFSVLISFVGYTAGSRGFAVRSQAPAPVEKTAARTPGAVAPARGGQPAGAIQPARGAAPARGGSESVLADDITFRVKVLEVPNTPLRREAVQKDVEFLKRQRVDPVLSIVNQRTNMVAIFAGAFKKDERDKAEQLRRRLGLMTVDGRLEFKDAQVVPVQ